jgi:imidazolonepropionase
MALTISLACSWFHLTPAEAIVGATLNAAYALRRNRDRGSIEVGKRGDLTVLDCAHPNELGTRIGAPLVRQVVARGRIIYQKEDSIRL